MKVSFVKFFFKIGLIVSILFVFLILIHFSIISLKFFKKENLYYFLLNDYQKENYKHLTKDEISNLLKATWYRKWKYSPSLSFTEGEHKSKFVNVNSFGVRANYKDKVVQYSDLNNSIWFFGGSTTFGYGVQDKYTIPAQLEKKIKIKTINFGSGFYGSNQENILFKSLITSHTPKIAIFLDGHNEDCNITAYQNEMRILFSEAQENYKWNFSDIFSPLNFYLNKFIKKIKRIDDNPWSKVNESCNINGKKIKLSQIIDDRLKERNSLCKLFKIECFTFLQPFPRIHVPHLDESRLSVNASESMNKLYLILVDVFLKNNGIELTDTFKNKYGHFYVDASHYSKEATELIAEKIYLKLLEKTKWLKNS